MRIRLASGSRSASSHDTAAPPSEVKAQGQIVGVVNDVHQQGLSADPYPAVYVGWGTFPINDVSFLVRSRAETATIAAGIRERVHADRPTDAGVRSAARWTRPCRSRCRSRASTCCCCPRSPALALLLAALGIYGVISYSVSQRTRELGIRIALGATQDRVVRLVLGQGVMLTVVGVSVGLAWRVLADAAACRAALRRRSRRTSLTFAGVALVLLGVASLASYLPARRARAVDPVIAMRAE